MRRLRRIVEARTGHGRRLLRAAFAAGAVAFLGGCSHFGNGMLEITPAVFSECQGPDIAVSVKWDATPVVKDGVVALLVYKPGRQPRLWLQVPPKGEAETGQWASDGWTVVLADAHGKPLATRTLQTTACPEAAG